MVLREKKYRVQILNSIVLEAVLRARGIVGECTFTKFSASSGDSKNYCRQSLERVLYLPQFHSIKVVMYSTRSSAGFAGLTSSLVVQVQ